MRIREKLLEREPPLRERMMFSQYTDHAIIQQRFGTYGTGMLQLHADGDIQSIGLERVDGAAGARDAGEEPLPVEELELALHHVDRVVGHLVADRDDTDDKMELAAAESGKTAAEIAAFPQTCLRGDRASLLEQSELSESAALDNELRHGVVSLASDASVTVSLR